MIQLRAFEEQDLDSLYSISLATGDAGGDASALYEDARLIGHIYSAPYAVLCPERCFVAEDDAGVAGFIVGSFDTSSFQGRLERDWWPGLRAIYPDPGGPPAAWSADQHRCHTIHHPRRTPSEVPVAYPAHLHLNLLPRAQGRGIGRSLLDLWLSNAQQAGVTGVHVGTNAENRRAVGFWEKCDFDRIPATSPSSEGGTIWLGRQLDGPVTV